MKENHLVIFIIQFQAKRTKLFIQHTARSQSQIPDISLQALLNCAQIRVSII